MLADGFEEVEALTVVDLLRRADIDVMMTSITGERLVHGTHGVNVEADMLFNPAVMKDIDAVVLPGGMPGAANLDADEQLAALLKDAAAKGAAVAAICAAPMILGHHGLLEGKKATIYSGMEGELYGAEHADGTVVIDGNIITSMGPGTAMDFGLALIAYLKDEKTSAKVRADLLYRG